MGTPNYMAPEIMVQAEQGYNQSAGESLHSEASMQHTAACLQILFWAYQLNLIRLLERR